LAPDHLLPPPLHASELRIAAIVAIGYGLLELAEGTGLWLDRLWADYLTVIATSLLKLYELVHRPSVWKAGGIVVNIAIVSYLAYLLKRRRRSSPRRKAPAPGTSAGPERTGP